MAIRRTRARNGFGVSWWPDKRPSRSLLLFLFLCLLAASPAPAQYAPPSTGGIVRLDRLLQHLSESRRVLLIGAHPDDEDTELLALLAHEHGADVAYLSLSRGEGGQNLIGEELGVTLGVVRTRELEAARAVDGAQQFFTRAYDFGYTRSLAETERFWTPDSILKDVLRIVRRFRPHVIVTVFSGTARDGHGQHQMSAVVGQRAFALAGNAGIFPELDTEEGLAPWTPRKLYRSARFDRGATTLSLSTGRLDPRVGKSVHQIAMSSRSQHRSQDFGALQPLGPAQSRLAIVNDRTGSPPRTGLFEGIELDRGWLQLLADSLREAIAPATMARAVPPLAAAVRRARAEGLSPDRQARLAEALAVAAGVVVDARAREADLLAGGDVEVEVEVYNAGERRVRFDRFDVGGWATALRPTAVEVGLAPRPGTTVARAVAITLPSDARATAPYFLRKPLRGALYDWSDVPAAVKGTPFGPATLEATVHLSIADAPIRIRQPVTHRWQDQAVGEIRDPVRIVPRVAVRVEPTDLVWSTEGPETQTVTVTLQHRGPGSVSGRVALRAESWPAPPAAPFSLEGLGATQQVAFLVRRPRGVTRADVVMRAVATLETGETFDQGTRELRYPHIRPTRIVEPAEIRIRVAPITVPVLGTVGYVRGASDRVPEALERLGVPVELLDAGALATGDLSVYDVIVIGARAYETDSALTRHNRRLLDYVRDGGRLVVQYQQYAFVRGEYAAFPLTINQPHDRITDETAPVTALVPDHPVFTTPNVIGPDDWRDWPQERGLYFAGTWDAAYTPLLEMQDPDRDPIRGGLLVAHLGRGTYVYTGLSFFRSLPAGTPGALRLFLNLLALEEAGVP